MLSWLQLQACVYSVGRCIMGIKGWDIFGAWPILQTLLVLVSHLNFWKFNGRDTLNLRCWRLMPLLYTSQRTVRSVSAWEEIALPGHRLEGATNHSTELAEISADVRRRCNMEVCSLQPVQPAQNTLDKLVRQPVHIFSGKSHAELLLICTRRYQKVSWTWLWLDGSSAWIQPMLCLYIINCSIKEKNHLRESWKKYSRN